MHTYFWIIFLWVSIYSVGAQNGVNEFDDNGKRHGVWRKFYNNDRVRYVGKFDHGKEIGVFKYFSASNSDNPVIVKEYTGSDNLAHVSFYTPGGALESKGKMQGKERVGKWLFYHPDGKSVMSEENYVNGKLGGRHFPSI